MMNKIYTKTIVLIGLCAAPFLRCMEQSSVWQPCEKIAQNLCVASQYRAAESKMAPLWDPLLEDGEDSSIIDKQPMYPAFTQPTPGHPQLFSQQQYDAVQGEIFQQCNPIVPSLPMESPLSERMQPLYNFLSNFANSAPMPPLHVSPSDKRRKITSEAIRRVARQKTALDLPPQALAIFTKNPLELLKDHKQKKSAQCEKKNAAPPHYPCLKCNQSFQTNHALQIHMNIHTGAKPYVCDVCGFNQNQPNNLKRHKKIHVDGPSKAYLCIPCNGKSMFALQCRCAQHLRLVHNIVKDHDRFIEINQERLKNVPAKKRRLKNG